ncbi:metal ABC transporter substrate-binding protein [Propionivibrio dicarboxylicus]|uniref:Zinc/manganese transport system substrate-binding protein n=1 Tax=Propionivibrio dicarboxylicus TaxID=83767 RepID=A0A1G8CZZ5_9RHOO|nr:metal ABC transporter substrate-binding protein [Propionivibrio dicarboxylicus]SDH50824.1 zinc/manganese transport system substrate-binding protein [Propionivibrio dicarboxylicus]
MHTLRSLWLALLILTLPFPALSSEPIPVVASFSILADMTRQIGGQRVAVHALVGENSDAHVYQPTPSDGKRLKQARLVIVNGLGFEGWIDRLVKSSGFSGSVIVASSGVKTLELVSVPGHEHGHQAHDVDPHAWLDAGNALRYVENIERALIQVDPEGKADYQANAERYRRRIAELDVWIRTTLGAIPSERRRVVTSHDAFGYFSRAYGIAFIAAVGINSSADPSAANVARIIRQLKKEKAPAIFVENISDTRLLERIQKESGARPGGVLYPDSLSKSNGPAATYLDLMRHNAFVLSASLQ